MTITRSDRRLIRRLLGRNRLRDVLVVVREESQRLSLADATMSEKRENVVLTMGIGDLLVQVPVAEQSAD